jgi:pilus assembly protein CpaF
MHTDLKQLVETIYSQSHPIIANDLQLIHRDNQKHFEQTVEEACCQLSPQDKQRVIDEIFAWGPITPLLTNENIFDIIINGPNHIFYEDPQGMHQLDDHFLSTISFRNFSELICNQAQVLLSQKDPFGNGKIQDFRVHIARSPVTPQTTITLRRHRKQVIPLQTLIENQFLSPQQSQIIDRILAQKNNFLVVGPTGCGKTTFINTLVSQISSQERLLILEDTDELACPSPLVTKLLTRDICPDSLTPISLGDLVKQSLRMRPDRIIVGEVRGNEAKDLLMALATGHSGSFATLHAQSAEQALIRLEMLIQMGAPHWSLHSIRQLIQLSLDYIIVLKGDRQNKGIMNIKKIQSHESFGLLTENVTAITQVQLTPHSPHSFP